MRSFPARPARSTRHRPESQWSEWLVSGVGTRFSISRFNVAGDTLYLLTSDLSETHFRRLHSMDAELIDRAEAIQQRILQLRDSL